MRDASVQILGFLFGIVHLVDDSGDLGSVGRRKKWTVVRLMVVIVSGVVVVVRERVKGLLVTLQGH